jgi:hypothetical protein
MKDDKLWRVFSEYVRRSHAIDGVCKCVTCGTVGHWKDMDAGHFISRNHKATKFDIQNVAPQCKKCNRFLGGRQYEFGIWIDQKYGEGTAEKILQRSRMVCKRSQVEIDVLTKHYKEELKKLTA